MKSRKMAVVALVALLVLGAEARGDGFPGRLVKTNVQVRVRFDGLENYPEYDFYVKYWRADDNPYQRGYVEPVTPGRTQILSGDGQYMADVTLLVVSRGKKPGQSDPSGADETIPGEMQSKLHGISYAARVSEDIAGYIMPYRVTIHDGIVEAAAESAELVAPGEWLGAHPITVGVWRLPAVRQ